MVVVVFVLVCKKPSHTYMFSTYYSCYIVKGHVEKVMAIVLLCESAQQFRALMIILQYHKILSMISVACCSSDFRSSILGELVYSSHRLAPSPSSA